MADLEVSAPKRRRTEEGGDGDNDVSVSMEGGHQPQQVQVTAAPAPSNVSTLMDMIGYNKRAIDEVLRGFEARGVDVEGTLRDVLRSKTDTESCKLFLRSLGWNTTKEQVREVYKDFGEIKELTIVETNGKSRGFGFVTFSNAMEAAEALAERCKSIDGRETFCNLASRPDEGHNKQNVGGGGAGGSPAGGNMGMGMGMGGPAAPMAAAGGGGGGSGGGPIDANGMTQEQKDKCRLFIRSLDWNTSENTLRTHFEQYGNVLDCAVIMDKDSGKSKGYGFITFSTPQEAQEALRERQKHIDGRTTHCNLASDRKRPNSSMMPSTLDTSQQTMQYQNHMQQYMQQLQLQQQQYYQQQQMAAAQQAAVDPAAAAQQQQQAFAYPQQAVAGQQWATAAVAQQQPAMAAQWGQQAVPGAVAPAAQPQFGGFQQQ